MSSPPEIGVILVNTGTTEAPRAPETRTYLREFLSDPRVLDISPIVRWCLLNFVILPKRPKNSAEAYEKIWTERGSPLLSISQDLQTELEKRMPNAVFAIGMRYGKPSIPDAYRAMIDARVKRIIVAPLFPQYSSAANGSALEMAYSLASKDWNVPALSALPAFYDDAGFLDSWEAVARPVLDDFKPDHVLFSYHGLPERHVIKSDLTGGRHCLAKAACCDVMVDANRHCYRAQSFATTRSIVERLGLSADGHSVSFQSRLGRDPWIKPATDEVVPELARRGVRRLAVLCPSFTIDCLETLEEIGMRAKEDFLHAGGEALVQVPCLNAHPAWADALAAMLRRL